MRDARTTSIDRASLVAWPVAWALVYYALTLSAVWGSSVHPIQAMLLMFGMAITGLIASAASTIWFILLLRREQQPTASQLSLREVIAFGAVSGAVPMTSVVVLYELLFIDVLGAVAVLGLVAAAGAAGAISAVATSGAVTLSARADSRREARTRAGTT